MCARSRRTRPSWCWRSATRSPPPSCAGSVLNASSGFSRSCMPTPRQSRRTLFSRTSTIRRPVPQPAVRRPVRVQRIPASRARSPRVPGAPAEHRRSQAAACVRSRRRQHAGGRQWTGRAHCDATPGVVCRGGLRRRGVCVDGRLVARRTRHQRLGVRSGRCRAAPETGPAVGRRRLLERPVFGDRAAHARKSVSHRLRLQRRRDTRRVPHLAGTTGLPGFRSHCRERWLA